MIAIGLGGLALAWLALALPALWHAKDGVGVALPWPLEPLLMRLKRPLEQRFERRPLSSSDRIAGLVVLGGHVARVTEAIRLAHAHPEALIVLTGARPDERALLLSQGFAHARVLLEFDAATTYGNANAVARLITPRAGDRWLLVTSALHMPRAMGTFEAQSLALEPWPVDDALPAPRFVAPVVLHECVGLLVYWMRGRIRTIFPGPKSPATDHQLGAVRGI